MKLNILWLSVASFYCMGLTFILFIMLPTWQEMQAPDFLNWSSANGYKVGILMAPLLVLSIILGSITAIKFKQKGDKTIAYLAIFSTAIFLVQLVLLFAYFLPLDLEFANQTLPLSSIKEKLAEWKGWHIARTIMAVIALLGIFILNFKSLNKYKKL